MRERARLAETRAGTADWKRWGPYLSERAWGTVREDYSADGTAWEYIPHDHARSRAYRWSEDGLGGICDSRQYLCLSLALWNERDPILKERLFGLTGNQGNHAEDCKEVYYYLDCTPTHSWMRFRYLYPIRAYPYAELLEENRRRGRDDPEYELTDTSAFDDGLYEVDVTYAKAAPEDILMRIDVTRVGPPSATDRTQRESGDNTATRIRVLPTLWFRNTWSWKHRASKPRISRVGPSTLRAEHDVLGARWCAVSGDPELLFCDNETNSKRLFDFPGSAAPKDAIGDAIVSGRRERLLVDAGTKVAAHYTLELRPGETQSIWVRLSNHPLDLPFQDATAIVADRQAEADAFYASLAPSHLPADSPRIQDGVNVQRQAFAGLLWSKQFYHYDVDLWLRGDPGQPTPPQARLRGRNHDWRHLYADDILSMPDKWEYPWFAAWDLVFHCIPLALVDPDFAKEQLVLLLREPYMHANGQIPAYEWAFGDTNPPVHAWAAWRVYKIDQKRSGVADIRFLERVFHKLLLNFNWWVNRKDSEGKNVFQGGFLGLDNVSIFDRSAMHRSKMYFEQADATSWMAMYCLNMLRIALELALSNSVYEDVASKFFEHFLYIAHTMNNLVEAGFGLWSEEDGFYYDILHQEHGQFLPVKVRSIVGLTPLFAVETLEPDILERLPNFAARFHWFINHRPALAANVASLERRVAGRRLLSVLSQERLVRLLRYMLDKAEFLSDFGIRSTSRIHLERPCVVHLDGQEAEVRYEPGESRSQLFGGNSNWRGPIWFPINYLIIESLQKFNHYYRDDLKVACPTGSDRLLNLEEVAADLSLRLVRLFVRDEHGRRPVFGEDLANFYNSREGILFYEYFHGDTGRGIGASHQTGWTGLVAKLITQSGDLLEGVESGTEGIRSFDEIRAAWEELSSR
ncbi:MAG TPA: glucosidase [Chloroflexota bacterium]|nr:glucosidase [Chloroflexota bacterium]